MKKTRWHPLRNFLKGCFGKKYGFSLGEPRSYPYEGKPMGSSVLTPENFLEYGNRSEGNEWDFTRFNPEHFRHLEYCIRELCMLGIEADLIIMHPYDRWGGFLHDKRAGYFILEICSCPLLSIQECVVVAC